MIPGIDIEGIVKKIMLGCIERYALGWEIPAEKVQIRVRHNPFGLPFYEICRDFAPQEQITFLQVLNKKLDLFGYEGICAPTMIKALLDYASKTQDSTDNVSAFILKHDKTLGISFYNGFENGKNILLSTFLAEYGF